MTEILPLLVSVEIDLPNETGKSTTETSPKNRQEYDRNVYPQSRRGLIHHSDHGSQYTSLAFGQRLHDAGILASRGSQGDCYDNALMESFFATLECELLDGRTFPTHRAARLGLFEFIEGFYNPHRRHSALGYCSPMEYERRWTTTDQWPTMELSTKAG